MTGRSFIIFPGAILYSPDNYVDMFTLRVVEQIWDALAQIYNLKPLVYNINPETLEEHLIERIKKESLRYFLVVGEKDREIYLVDDKEKRKIGCFLDGKLEIIDSNLKFKRIIVEIE